MAYMHVYLNRYFQRLKPISYLQVLLRRIYSKQTYRKTLPDLFFRRNGLQLTCSASKNGMSTHQPHRMLGITPQERMVYGIESATLWSEYIYGANTYIDKLSGV
jgi:hypothetical protein